MNKLRGAAMLVVVLLVLPACHCKERTDSRNITEKNLMNFIVRLIKEVKVYRLQEGNGKQHLARKEDYSLDEKENPMPDYGYYQDEQRVEIVPRDLRMKEKFLKHLTGKGRLSFNSPNCNKLFRRLYNTTKDCTTPAHYKRCARLLTRLAVNPRCMDG
ncbi:hypothetical protein XENTR_v10014909 [Xenopus tropicalis]|uniref:ALK and LTK ligand 2 n=1 Tax=Xenopus tropicalis TaxID=8364 RepID=A0A6I8SLB5_XENTR|eukprot:XP_002936342.2 PREDICTED: protein FAM150B isoform X1 [Xenopus tropicalis]